MRVIKESILSEVQRTAARARGSRWAAPNGAIRGPSWARIPLDTVVRQGP